MTSETNIWILEDDKACQFVYEEILGIRYRITFFDSLDPFKAALMGQERPDLLIADIRLPGDSFLSLLKTEDSMPIRVPFIVVSSVDDLDALRLCFKYGARDYITKPFGKSELIVKIERILGETASRENTIAVNPTSLTVLYRGKHSSALTSKEFQIVSQLREAPGNRRTREELTLGVWGDTNVGPKTLDVHLANLRRKLEPIGVRLEFVSPNSYQLEH